jgi:hypothetical protein
MSEYWPGGGRFRALGECSSRPHCEEGRFAAWTVVSRLHGKVGWLLCLHGFIRVVLFTYCLWEPRLLSPLTFSSERVGRASLPALLGLTLVVCLFHFPHAQNYPFARVA